MSDGERTAPNEPATSSFRVEVSDAVTPLFCSRALELPPTPTRRSEGRVEKGTRPLTVGMESAGSMITTTNVESSVHSPE